MTPGSAEAGVRAAFDEEIGKTVEIIATATEKDARSRCEVVFMGAILTCVTRHSKGLGFRRSLEGCDCAWAPEGTPLHGLSAGRAIDVGAEAAEQCCRH